MNDTAQIVRQAEQARIKTPTTVKLRQWAESRSTVEIAAVLGIMSAMIVATIWESNNAGLGFYMLSQGVVWQPLAYLFGAICPIGYFWFHRRASEFYRSGKAASGSQAAIVAIIFTGLTLFGVFSNIASKTEMQALKAGESNSDRALLRAEVLALRSQVTPEEFLLSETTIGVTRTQIESTLAEAKGWGMEDLDPVTSCAADLRPRQRQLCNRMNGTERADGSLSMGLLNELRMNEGAFEILQDKKRQLDEKEELLRTTKREEGDGHWKSMERIAQGGVSADDFRIWGSFFLSIGVLMVLGFGWDNFLEEREEEFDEIPPAGTKVVT